MENELSSQEEDIQNLEQLEKLMTKVAKETLIKDHLIILRMSTVCLNLLKLKPCGILRNISFSLKRNVLKNRCLFYNVKHMHSEESYSQKFADLFSPEETRSDALTITENVLNEQELNDLMSVYYRRLFPYSMYYKWLSYGNGALFCNRELAFTVEDNRYLRYNSFESKEEMKRKIIKFNPYKIHIGAVYSHPPLTRKEVSGFHVVEKELTFDIDMNDYAELKSCCWGDQVCPKCWRFMEPAVKILDTALREEFGYQHILWVFSGRRGVHCWVCDKRARSLSEEERIKLANHLELFRSSAKKPYSINDNVGLSNIMRSAKIGQSYFESICLEEQKVLSEKTKWNKIATLIPDLEVRKNVIKKMYQYKTSKERWEVIKEVMVDEPRRLNEMMLHGIYPRLDLKVTTEIRHLLKSPFSVHPLTGNIAIPFEVDNIHNISPFNTPSLSSLANEILEYDSCTTSENLRPIANATSLRESLLVFEKFVHNLQMDNDSEVPS